MLTTLPCSQVQLGELWQNPPRRCVSRPPWAAHEVVLCGRAGTGSASRTISEQTPVHSHRLAFRGNLRSASPVTLFSLPLILLKSLLRPALWGAWGLNLRGGAVPRLLAFLVLPQGRRQTGNAWRFTFLLWHHICGPRRTKCNQVLGGAAELSGKSCSGSRAYLPFLAGGGGGWGAAAAMRAPESDPGLPYRLPQTEAVWTFSAVLLWGQS